MSMRRIIFARAPLGKTTPRCVVNSVTRTALTRVVARTFSRASFNPRLHSTINAPKKFSLHQQRTYASAPEGMYKLVMPALSPTMTQGNLAKWRKKVGDKIKPGDVLAEIETDKATLDFEATDEGYLARILVPAESQNVPVGKVIAITVEEEADIAKITDELVNSIVGASSTASAAPTQATAQKPQPQQQPQQQQSQSHQATGVSPAARFLIDTENLDPSSIKPTGKGGRLTKSDVILALENNTVRRLPAAEKPQATATAAAATTTTTTATAAPRSEKPTAVYQDIPTTQMRKVIAQRLTESKQRVPHFYVSFEARIDHIMKLRASILETLGAKVSLNDFIILAVARALNECPECNVIFDQAKNEVVQSNTVDISIAVATDKGLITPIVKQADKMTVIDISTAVKNLAARAREGKLKPEEFQGGSFSISNLGMFGISDFSAVINPPQAIILAVGGSEKRAIVNGATSAFTSEEDYDDAISRPVTIEYTNDGVPTNIGMGTFISGSLSCDRRAVDEAQVSKFLAALQKHIRAMGLI